MDNFDSVLTALDFESEAEEQLLNLDDSGFPSGESSRDFWARGFGSVEASMRAAGWEGQSSLLPMLSPVETQALNGPSPEGVLQVAIDEVHQLQRHSFLHPLGVDLRHSLVFYATQAEPEGAGASAAVLVGVTRAGQQWGWLRVEGETPLLLDLTDSDLPLGIPTVAFLRQVADWVLLTMGEELPAPLLSLTDVVLHCALEGAAEFTQQMVPRHPNLAGRQAEHAWAAATEFRRQLLTSIRGILRTARGGQDSVPFEELLETLEVSSLRTQEMTTEDRRKLEDPRVLEVIDEGLALLQALGWEGLETESFAELVGAPHEVAEWVGTHGLGRLAQMDMKSMQEMVGGITEWVGEGVEFLISDLEDLGVELY